LNEYGNRFTSLIVADTQTDPDMGRKQ